MRQSHFFARINTPRGASGWRSLTKSHVPRWRSGNRLARISSWSSRDVTCQDVFGPALVDELRAHPFDFDLQVQLCTDLTAMPVNDATVEWPEKLSPFVTVGRVRLPRQDISAPENLEKGDALAFNQWRVTSDHRPLGEIMDVRRIYSASAKIRRTLNHQPLREPATVDDVLTLPTSPDQPTTERREKNDGAPHLPA